MSEASDEFVLVYEELRRIARLFFRSQAAVTLQPTALVHEVFLRLAGRDARFADRTHFLSVAARATRQILVDQARRRHAQRRGGGAVRVTLTDAAPQPTGPDPVDVLALDEALQRLAVLSPRQARVMELVWFGGLSAAEVAAALDVSVSLVEKEGRMARAWLRQTLSASPGDDA